MVQFLKDPVFNTSLIVGYYWIPLCVLVVLYANIFHAAWTLSQKSREKEKEREKLLALSKKPPGQPAAANPAVGIAVVAAMTYQGQGGRLEAAPEDEDDEEDEEDGGSGAASSADRRASDNNVYGGKYSPSQSGSAARLLPRPEIAEEGTVRRKPAPPLRDENTVLRHRPAMNGSSGGDCHRHQYNHHNHVTFEQHDRVSLQSSTPTNSLPPPPPHPMHPSLHHNRLSMLGENNLSEEDSSSGGFRARPTVGGGHPPHSDSGCRYGFTLLLRHKIPHPKPQTAFIYDIINSLQDMHHGLEAARQRQRRAPHHLQRLDAHPADALAHPLPLLPGLLLRNDLNATQVAGGALLLLQEPEAEAGHAH